MANGNTSFDTVVIGPGISGGRGPQRAGDQRPEINAGDARRIAELEREVRELRRSNEILKVYFARELELPLPAVGTGTADDGDYLPGLVPAPAVAPDAAGWAGPGPAGIPAAPPPLAEFRVLGPIEAVVGGQLTDLGAPKQRALLALLVSRVGQPVTVDVIVEELWNGRPPPSAITSLQAYVANLRRVLEPGRPPRTPATVLCTRSGGYLLDSRVVAVDVQRFDERAAAGWQALSRGDPQQALAEFGAGLALWRGQAYAEVVNATHVVPEIVRLEELRLSVTEGRCAALLAVGAHEVAVAELEAFARAHPLREYCCELLSLALYRAGRQADALATLQSNQQRLADELGIDPNPALQRLQREILNQAPALDWQPPQPQSPRWAGCEPSEIA